MTTYTKEWHYYYCMGETECRHGDPECPHNHFLKNEACSCPDYTDNTEWLSIVLHNYREFYGKPNLPFDPEQKAIEAIEAKLKEARINELERHQSHDRGLSGSIHMSRADVEKRLNTLRGV